MTRLEWDILGSRHYEAGVDRGVLYPAVGPGVSWNGLTAVGELEGDTPEGKIIYFDGERHSSELGIGTFAAIISALTYPKEFEPHDGYDAIGFSNQTRKPFHFSYRSRVGNDTKAEKYGYLIHLVYNALATPTSVDRNSLYSTIDPSEFKWGISTTPVFIPEARATSHFIIDTTKAYPDVISAMEDILYGTSSSSPRMPTITEILDLFEEHAIFKVIHHGDGTATVSGPDTAVYETSPNLWMLDWPSVIQLDEHLYKASSL